MNLLYLKICTRGLALTLASMTCLFRFSSATPDLNCASLFVGAAPQRPPYWMKTLLATVREASGTKDALFDTQFLDTYIRDLFSLDSIHELPGVEVIGRERPVSGSYFPQEIVTALQSISDVYFKFFMGDVFTVKYTRYWKASLLDSEIFRETVQRAQAFLIPISSTVDHSTLVSALRTILGLNLRSRDPYLLGVYFENGTYYLAFELTSPPASAAEPRQLVGTRGH